MSSMISFRWVSGEPEHVEHVHGLMGERLRGWVTINRIPKPDLSSPGLRQSESSAAVWALRHRCGWLEDYLDLLSKPISEQSIEITDHRLQRAVLLDRTNRH